MFGSVSFNEILVILVLALLIFGPKRLPQIGRTIGRALGEFRRASSELKRTVEAEMATIDETVSAVRDPKEGLAAVQQTVERGSAPVIEDAVPSPPKSEETSPTSTSEEIS